jgi:hypothetical protein
MFSTSNRDTTREVFFRAWRNHREGKPLEGIERVLVQVALRHPEYHALLDDPAHGNRDYAPALGETNPFLHMGLHIAIEEQLTLGEPAGIREAFQRLMMQLPDEHEVQHRMMECLAECIYQMQQQRRDFDAAPYIECLARQATARR